MGVAPVIHIGGWPGAGKRTIGRRVADTLGGRLIDNHLMLDAARAIYERGTTGSSKLREEVRQVILRHARNLPSEVPIIITDALAKEPAAAPLFQPTLDLAQDRGAPLRCFLLDLNIDENLRRLTDPARSGHAKLTDPDVLIGIRAKDRLFEPKGVVTLDVTGFSADDAAHSICHHLERADG